MNASQQKWIEVEKKSPVQARVRVKVPARTVNERLNAFFGQLAKRVNIAGFRPGKAPLDVVKKKYNEDAKADLSERLIAEFLGKALQEEKLEIVLPPVLVATDLPTENKDFNFEVELDLKPALSSVDLSGLEIEDFKVEEPTLEEVEAELNAALEAEASYQDPKEDRAAQNSDYVLLKFEGKLDGKVESFLTADRHVATLGRGELMDEFEKNILGMKKGETKTYPVTFPEDYREERLKGKTVEFKTTLMTLKEKILPALNDEFAKSADPSVTSLDELKKKISERLKTSRERSRKQELRRRIGDALVQKFPIEVSARQVETATKHLAEDTHRMMHEMGIKHEETEEHAKALFESSRKKAERDVRLTYILEAIARDQKLEVSQTDIEARFEEAAQKTGMSVAQIRSHYLSKDQDGQNTHLERLRIDILDEKSLDYALSKATIKFKDGA